MISYKSAILIDGLSIHSPLDAEGVAGVLKTLPEAGGFEEAGVE